MRALRIKPDGSRRIVIAHLNVGQAEDYRRYWQKDWRSSSPNWILAADPDGWRGNYPVSYWHAAWQTAIARPEGILNSIIALGFDASISTG